ncbi:MAG: lipase maturation factor family protein [bacterium]
MTETGERNLLTRWIFLRGMALVWLAAFASLSVQVNGLFGLRGIEPVARLLQAAGNLSPAERFFHAPTLLWVFGASDHVLREMCGTGVLLSVLLGLGFAPGPICLALWALYLSFVTVGSPFLDFQWDLLLLEAGLCACVMAPWRLRASGLLPERAPSAAAVWLPRFLLFKLVWMSGLVKIASGDPTWRNLTALQYHYWTTCLPTWSGWWMNRLPPEAHRITAGIMFALELVASFLVLAPRPARVVGFFAMLALQLGIALTGNYGFFNLLTVVLCLAVLDDRDWLWLRRFALGDRAAPMLTTTPAGASFMAPTRAESSGVPSSSPPPSAGPQAPPALPIHPRDVPAWALAALIVLASLFHIQGRFLGYEALPAPALELLGTIEPFHSVNPYGLFATMTTRRPEIIIEGSRDGETWIPYEFKWKPGDVKRRPEFMQPHMPRLDWQMWFAALESWPQNPWFASFLSRLLEGSPPVLKLLARDPFDGNSPRFVRATLWEYRFADPATRRATGAWWTRTKVGDYGPVLERPHQDEGLRTETHPENGDIRGT